MDYYDVTAPVAPLTGKEKSVAELSTPDERMKSYAGYSVEQVQAVLDHSTKSLGAMIPAETVRRLEVAKTLAVYGWFQWDFFVVSLLWSLTAIEMALKAKFVEQFAGSWQVQNKKEKRTLQGSFEQLEELLRDRWQVEGLSRFNGSFRSLLVWARDHAILPPDTPVVLQELRFRFENLTATRLMGRRLHEAGLISDPDLAPAVLQSKWGSLSQSERDRYGFKSIDVLVEEVPDLRNRLAHPTSFNWTLSPRSSLDGFAQAVAIVNRLWPA